MLVGNWLKQRRHLHTHISMCLQYLRTCKGSSLNRMVTHCSRLQLLHVDGLLGLVLAGHRGDTDVLTADSCCLYTKVGFCPYNALLGAVGCMCSLSLKGILEFRVATVQQVPCCNSATVAL
jgi:hypothetical protein